ncbi:hypothetical protein E4U39_001175 [Claviceps sp. Clav50 group G5]|nr:hypothetical protein E4U39_001175 [Claviceps sp. Clav50 group G5]
MPVELSDWLSSVIANARDAAAKAEIESALQEALKIIQKPVNSQGGRASGTAESPLVLYQFHRSATRSCCQVAAQNSVSVATRGKATLRRTSRQGIAGRSVSTLIPK